MPRKLKVGSIILRLPIDVRPDIINSRQQFGHFEIDGVESSKSKYIVLTRLAHKTLMLFAIIIPNKLAQTVARAIESFAIHLQRHCSLNHK